jgi:hypothetical protein
MTNYSDPAWVEFEQFDATTVARPRDDFAFRYTQLFTGGLRYKPGEIVYNETDKLVYVCIKATSVINDIAPDYADTDSNAYWTWVAGSISSEVSGRGRWTKFADGTLIQHGNRTDVENSTVENKIRAIVFPISFFDDGEPVDISFSIVNSSYSTKIYNQVVANATYVGCNLVFYLADSASRTFTRSWIAIGRWKA